MSYRVRHPELHQEVDEVPSWKVLAAAAGCVAISTALILWTVSVVNGSFAELRPSLVFPERWLGPRHIVSRVRQDLFTEQHPNRTIHAQERRRLASYGWADEARGLVRIPIEEAMDLVAGEEKP